MENRRWSDSTKQWVVIGAAIVLALALYRFSRIVTPVIVAALLAYVLHPAVSFLQRGVRIPRTLAAILVYLVLLALIVLVPVLVIPALVEQVRQLNLNLQDMLAFVQSVFRQPIVIGGFTIELTRVYDQLAASVQTLFSSVASGSMNFLLNVASGIAWFIIVLVLSFWLVRDEPFIRQRLERVAPRSYQRDVQLLGQQIVQVWRAFFQGQLILCLVVGLVVFLALTIVGLPYALLMGLIAGVLELIPNIGPAVAAIPAVLVALIRGSNYLPLSPFWFAVLVAGLYILIQQVENNLLVPRIMGHSLNLHPLVVLVGVLAGASVAGILGIFLAAPTLATLRVLGRYMYRRLLDEEPFPAEEESKAPMVVLPIGGVKREDVRGVLFDLDGTLIDSDDSAIRDWTRKLRPVNWLFRNRNPERFLRHLVMNGEGFVNGLLLVLDKVGLDRPALAISDSLRRSWRGRGQGFLPVPGVTQMLESLRGKYRLGVVTTRGQKDARAFLSQIGLAELFEVVIAREDVRRLKPHPEPILKAAQALNLAPEQCLMVGDTSPDVRSAKRAGAQAAGVLCGLGTLDDLKSADLILASTADLASHLLN